MNTKKRHTDNRVVSSTHHIGLDAMQQILADYLNKILPPPRTVSIACKNYWPMFTNIFLIPTSTVPKRLGLVASAIITLPVNSDWKWAAH